MIKFLQSGNKAAKYLLAGFLLILAASMVTYLIPGFMGDKPLRVKPEWWRPWAAMRSNAKR